MPRFSLRVWPSVAGGTPPEAEPPPPAAEPPAPVEPPAAPEPPSTAAPEAAADAAPPEPAKPVWADMNEGQSAEFMKTVVAPRMSEVFKELDAKDMPKA